MSPRTAGIVALAGILGWAGLVWLGWSLYVTSPPTAAFDLELLLRAGRDVAAGRSPYDPAMLAGTAPVAERLFYSYPPAVAQAMSLVAAVPSPLIFVAWSGAAVAGLGFVAWGLAERLGGGRRAPGAFAVAAVALAPLVSPFAVGLLFGNLDVFFPLLFGLALLGVLPRESAGDATRAGAGVAVATTAKLHPGSLGVWLLVRSARAADVRRIVLAAAVTLGVILAISLAVGGTQPWLDYLSVVRAGSGADLVDPRNAGPAAQVALVLRGSGPDADALARSLQIPITLAALGATALVARRLADPVESLAWAAAVSLVVLPVTWYHYPSALIPFALAALLRADGAAPAVGRRVRRMLAAAAVTAAIAIAWLPLLYAAIGLVLGALRMSAAADGPAQSDPATRFPVAE
jgi:hypothetical protein